ncbi:RNA polymerase sigma factor [Streptomyces sp. NEAU-174]|uniref:RNA polymerase sigma factor n=1 Tax=Streptomyces sp. NEAU-174 TaxID=3458254 RepID=UPI0040450DF4
MLSDDKSPNGDPTDAEFTKIYNAHLGMVKAVIFIVADKGADVDAIAQETFIRLLTRLNRGERINSPQALLRKIATETAIDHNRSAAVKRSSATEVVPEGGMWFSVAETLSPETALEFAELLDTIKTVLSPELRNALLLREYIGFTPRVTAGILGIRSATVSTNVLRAKRALNRHYALAALRPHGMLKGETA